MHRLLSRQGQIPFFDFRAPLLVELGADVFKCLCGGQEFSLLFVLAEPSAENALVYFYLAEEPLARIS